MPGKYDTFLCKLVLLLLIRCSLLLPLCVSVNVLCFVVRYFMFILVNRLDGEEGTGCFAWFVFLVSRACCVVLLCGAMGLFAVCGCGIFGSYSLTIFLFIGMPHQFTGMYVKCVVAFE